MVKCSKQWVFSISNHNLAAFDQRQQIIVTTQTPGFLKWRCALSFFSQSEAYQAMDISAKLQCLFSYTNGG